MIYTCICFYVCIYICIYSTVISDLGLHMIQLALPSLKFDWLCRLQPRKFPPKKIQSICASYEAHL